MRTSRRRAGLCAAIGAFALIGAGCVPPPPPPPPNSGIAPGGVVVYGDSLLENSVNYFSPGAVLVSFGGTAICDWYDRMHADAPSAPSKVVLAFSGNVRACWSGQSRYDAYRSNVQSVQAIFPSAQVYVVLPPQMQGTPNNEVAQAFRDSGAIVLDGRTPLGGDTYTAAMPCLPDETPAHGCDAGGNIVVRGADGVHFCDDPGACDAYSSGSRRYAEAASLGWTTPAPTTTTTSSSTSTSTTSPSTSTSTTTTTP